eukprot:gene8543-990_t
MFLGPRSMLKVFRKQSVTAGVRSLDIAVRSVKLAANDTELPNDDVKADSASATAAASTVNSISRGLGRLIFSSSHATAQFEVVANGLGSLVHIFFPAHSYVKVRPGTVIARSSSLTAHRSFVENPFKAIARKIGGGPFALETIAASNLEGDCLVSPSNLGDVAILGLNGAQSYCISNKSFLASTSSLHLGLSFLIDVNPILSKMYMKASGTGSLAITAPGGLFRLVLEPGEKYLASAKHLVAWDSTMNPKFRSHENTAEDSLVVRVVSSIRRIFKSNQSMCELHGPGDFYLTSRLEGQRASGSRLFSMLSRNDSEDHRSQIVTVTPSPVFREDSPPTVSKVNFTPDKTKPEPIRDTKTPNLDGGKVNITDAVSKKRAQDPPEAAEEKNPESKPWYKFW